MDCGCSCGFSVFLSSSLSVFPMELFNLIFLDCFSDWGVTTSFFCFLSSLVPSSSPKLVLGFLFDSFGSSSWRELRRSGSSFCKLLFNPFLLEEESPRRVLLLCFSPDVLSPSPSPSPSLSSSPFPSLLFFFCREEREERK